MVLQDIAHCGTLQYVLALEPAHYSLHRLNCITLCTARTGSVLRLLTPVLIVVDLDRTHAGVLPLISSASHHAS